MRLTIDFETRSACDLRKCGTWVYAEHPTTSILCMAYKPSDRQGVPHLWRPGDVTQHMFREMERAETIEAHNMAFEFAVWTKCGVPKYGLPPLSMEKLRCSAAKAAMHGLPRSLEGAGAALGLPIQKDQAGHMLMMKMCKPRRTRKAEAPSNPADPHGLYWFESEAELERLYAYCMHDVLAEEVLSEALRDLPDAELAIWRLDMIINARGIQADMAASRAMVQMIGEHEAALLDRLSRLTFGAIRTARQVTPLQNYLRGRGVDLPDLTAETVQEALHREDLDDDTRELLEIRRSLARSSSAKYRAIISRASADGRIRGSLLYHGAGTGRWAGAGIQPQNFPSRIKTSAPPEDLLECILKGGLGLHNALYDDDPMSSAGAITRSVLTAKEGHDLIAADYSAIEGRGLAWLAGEETELAVYRSDQDVYVAAAAMILGKPYEAVTKEERQSPGKVATLACGYGGSVGAVRNFGGEGMTDDEIKARIVYPWRDAHPMTVRFWRELEEACTAAVANPGLPYYARAIAFRVQGGFLLCRLPSGRLLYYYDPDIRPTETSWGEIKDAVTYMSVDGNSRKWTRTSTYGGKLAENVTQAICRDILADAMVRVERAGYPIVLTVHDEIVCEVPEGFGSVQELEALMCIRPKWAPGFPIAASGYRSKRYKKG